MGVYELLVSKEDARKGSPLCEFNGFLEDYLQMLDEEHPDRAVLNSLFEADKDLHVIVNLQMGISRESISNQIIRYKDIFKLEDKAVVIPYVLYAKHEEAEKALLLVGEDYIYAKGMYYSLTEPSSELQAVKNDIVAMDSRDPALILQTYEKLFTRRAGQIQRELDHRHFRTYEESYQHALELSEGIRNELAEKLNAGEDREELIRSCISRWFLIKKFVYVQFMVDKNILNTQFEGNVKAQRNQAKQNADNIRFVSISDMWRGRIEGSKPEVKAEPEIEEEIEVDRSQPVEDVVSSVAGVNLDEPLTEETAEEKPAEE
ncbi:MAG: hypothetical protein IKE21_06205 [Erysipelotrichaceae bacterium]|nr:hypothetical protein [Erysipelotrichaceae bacterium]